VVKEKIARPLNLDVLQAAEGIIRVVNANMIRGIRRVSVEQGYDPRDFVLVAFGGAGPLHAADLAQALNMKKVIIPAHPGIGSAFGMLAADVRHDYVKTRVSLATELDYCQVEMLFVELEKQATQQLSQEGFAGKAIVLNRFVDMRYLRQAYELTVPFTGNAFNKRTVEQLVQGFHMGHSREYGYARKQEPVEIVNLRLVAIGKLPRIQLHAEEFVKDGRAEPVSQRPVYFEGLLMDTPIYHHRNLMPGQMLEGPAVVEQFDSTVVITPSFSSESDIYGNMILTSKDGT
jgi:N-methylhydantoinase A